MPQGGDGVSASRGGQRSGSEHDRREPVPVPGLPAPENLRAEPDAGPAQYGAINAVYAALFAGVLVATRGRDAEAERLGSAELLPLSAATFSISKIIAREKVGSWVREPFVDDPVGRKQPRGGRFQRALGELVTCSRCVGAWTALGPRRPAARAAPHAGAP